MESAYSGHNGPKNTGCNREVAVLRELFDAWRFVTWSLNYVSSGNMEVHAYTCMHAVITIHVKLANQFITNSAARSLSSRNS